MSEFPRNDYAHSLLRLHGQVCQEPGCRPRLYLRTAETELARMEPLTPLPRIQDGPSVATVPLPPQHCHMGAGDGADRRQPTSCLPCQPHGVARCSLGMPRNHRLATGVSGECNKGCYTLPLDSDSCCSSNGGCSSGSSSCCGHSRRPRYAPSPSPTPASAHFLLLLVLVLAPVPNPLPCREGRQLTFQDPKTSLGYLCSRAPADRGCGTRGAAQSYKPASAMRAAEQRQWRSRASGLMLAAAATNAAGAAGFPGPSSSMEMLSEGEKGSLLLRPSFDASLDWASNVTAKGKDGCTLAKKAANPAFVPPRCPPPRRPVGIEEARQLGWRFAPLLHQHPLDWSRLSDPGAWLQSAVLVDPVTYTTTDLTTYLENRHKARRAKAEKAAAEAEAAAAAASGGGGGSAAAKAKAAAARAAAAAAEAVAADPYWLIHEAYDTHNFFATRLVRRRYGVAMAATPGRGREAQQQQRQQPESLPAADGGKAGTAQGAERSEDVRSAEAGPAGGGRRRMTGREHGVPSGGWQRRQLQLEAEVVLEGGGGGGGARGDGDGGGTGAAGSPSDEDGRLEEEQQDPDWPHFEALQGEEFFAAIAGDPLVEEGEGEEADDEAEAAKGQAGGGAGGEGREEAGRTQGRRRAAAKGGGAGGGGGRGGSSRRGGRLGGRVYYTVFEPRLEHLHWSRPARASTAEGEEGAGPAGDMGPTGASAAGGGGGGFTAPGSEPTHAYVYTFWFFYPFNGCSNQLMATRFAGRHQAAEYFLCPLGVHEGDWEHLKVYVCQEGMLDEHDPAPAVAALQYSQHTWLPTYDCTKGGWPGECAFAADPDTGQRRPRVFSGLHSHANSPHTSSLNVYAKVNFKQLLNFDGIYVADRFAGGGPTFVPSPANTQWLPFPHEMALEDARPTGRLAWTAYLGNWGVPLTSPNFSLTCLNRNLTAAAPCDPRNPPVFILDRLLGGVTTRPGDITWTPVLSPKRVAPELAEPISCPLVRRGAAYSWERELSAPLWDDREPLPGLGGISLAALARDTSSLDCPLAEDLHRNPFGSSSWGAHYLGADPRVAHRLRLFVGAATAAVVAAAALSALVVKCMPLILAPYHRPNHHHHHHHRHHHNHPRHEHGEGVNSSPDTGYGAYGSGTGGGHGPAGPSYEQSYHSYDARRWGGGGGGEGEARMFALVYGKYDNSPYEPLPQYDDDDDLRLRVTAMPTPVHHRQQLQQQGGGGTAAAGGNGDGDHGGSDSGASSSESYSSFNEPLTASDNEAAASAGGAAAGAGPHRISAAVELPYRSHAHPLSYMDGPGGKTNTTAATTRPSAASGSGLPPPPLPPGQQAPAMRFSESGGGGVGGGIGGGGGAGPASAHRRGSEEQPLLASAGRGRDPATAAAAGGDDGDGDDDDDGNKPRRGMWRGLASFNHHRTAVTCPAVQLLPLLAWRGCLAACRCVYGVVGYPWRCRTASGGASSSSSSPPHPPPPPPRRRRHRGVGPYLLGCAVQPERRLLWLSLGIMSYSLGLIMSAQGLLQTLHALRNLLLRGLWAIAGLEGVFVALLAAGGVLELGLMVAAVSLAPKPESAEHPRHPRHHHHQHFGGIGGGGGGDYAPRRAAGGHLPTTVAAAPPAAVAAVLQEGDADSPTDGGAGTSLPLSTAAGLAPGSGATSGAPPVGGDGPAPSTIAMQPLPSRGSGAAAAAAANGPVLPSASSALPLLPLLGSVSGGAVGGGALDWESYGISHTHLQFPTTAAVAATAVAATAAATAAASAAASAAATAAARVPWRTMVLLAAVGYMEVAASLHLLGFGLALWVGVLGASEGCSAAVQGLYRVISFSPDVCLDLSMIGVPGPRCGGDLMQMCNVWRQLRLSGLLYGSLLIIAARLLLLVMAAANYHSRHMVLLQLPPPAPTPAGAAVQHQQGHQGPFQGGGRRQNGDAHWAGLGQEKTTEGEDDGAAAAAAAAATGIDRLRRETARRRGVRAKATEGGASAGMAEDGGGGAAAAAVATAHAALHWRESGQETRRRSGRRRRLAAEDDAAAASAAPLLDVGGGSGSARGGSRAQRAPVLAGPPGVQAGGGGDSSGGGGVLPVSTPAAVMTAASGQVVLELGSMGQAVSPAPGSSAAGAGGGSGSSGLGAGHRESGWRFFGF